MAEVYPSAIRVCGQVKAELNSVAPGGDPAVVAALEARIHGMLFADRVEEEEHV